MRVLLFIFPACCHGPDLVPAPSYKVRPRGATLSGMRGNKPNQTQSRDGIRNFRMPRTLCLPPRLLVVAPPPAAKKGLPRLETAPRACHLPWALPVFSSAS